MADFVSVHIQNRKEETLLRRDQIQRVSQTRTGAAQIYLIGRSEPIAIEETYKAIHLTLGVE